MDSEERDPKLDQRLDQWLDDALAGYTKAEPRPGLEQRITATLRAEERAPARRRWWLILTPATAALAVLVVFVALHQNHVAEKTTQTVAMQTAPPSEHYTRNENAELKENAQPESSTTAAAPAPKSKVLKTEVAPARVQTTPSAPAQPRSADVDLLADNKSAAPSGATGGIISRNAEPAPLSRNVAALPAPSTLAKAESTEPPPHADRMYASINVPSAPATAQAAPPAPPGQVNQTVEVTAAAPIMTVVPSAAPMGVPTLDKKSAKSARADSSPYKLDFVLREFEDDKIVNQRNYTLTVRAGEWQQIRVDGPVTADANEVITLLLNCRIVPGTEDNTTLTTIADITSTSYIAGRSAKSDGSAPPVHRVQMNTNALITLGKPTVLSAADESNSKRRFELVVTVKKAK